MHSLRAFVKNKNYVIMVYVTDVIKKQFYVLWKVQNDSKMQQHKDTITSHQFGKMDSNKMVEKNLLRPCVDDTSEFSFLFSPEFLQIPFLIYI